MAKKMKSRIRFFKSVYVWRRTNWFTTCLERYLTLKHPRLAITTLCLISKAVRASLGGRDEVVSNVTLHQDLHYLDLALHFSSDTTFRSEEVKEAVQPPLAIIFVIFSSVCAATESTNKRSYDRAKTLRRETDKHSHDDRDSGQKKGRRN